MPLHEYEAIACSAAPSRTRTTSTTRGVLDVLLRYVAKMALLLAAFSGATVLLAGKHSVLQADSRAQQTARDTIVATALVATPAIDVNDAPLEAHKVRLKSGKEGWRLELPGQPGGAVIWKNPDDHGHNLVLSEEACSIEDGKRLLIDGRRMTAEESSVGEEFVVLKKMKCTHGALPTATDPTTKEPSPPSQPPPSPPPPSPSFLREDLAAFPMAQEYMHKDNDTRVCEGPGDQTAFVNRLKEPMPSQTQAFTTVNLHLLSTAKPGDTIPFDFNGQRHALLLPPNHPGGSVQVNIPNKPITHDDVWTNFLNTVMNKYRDTQPNVCTTPPCFAADYDKCIGTNSGRPFAFGRRSIAALSRANIDESKERDPQRRADRQAACDRVSAQTDEIAVSTRLPESLDVMRACAENSVWRTTGVGGNPVNGNVGVGRRSCACRVAWPVLIKAHHFEMLHRTGDPKRTGGYDWKEILTRPGCLFGMFSSLHGTLGRAATQAEQNRLVTTPLKQQTDAIAVFMRRASAPPYQPMAPHGGTISIWHPNSKSLGTPLYTATFDSFQWTDIGSQRDYYKDGRGTRETWKGLPLLLVQFYEDEIWPDRGGSLPQRFIYDWFRGSRGVKLRSSHGNGTLMAPTPIKGYGYEICFNTAPGVVSPRLCIGRPGG